MDGSSHSIPNTQPATPLTQYAIRTTHLFKEWNRQDAFAPPAVALLLVGTLSLLTLADPAFARDSARAYRWTIVEPVLFYFLITDVISTRRGLWRIADFFVAAAVVAALAGSALASSLIRVLTRAGRRGPKQR